MKWFGRFLCRIGRHKLTPFAENTFNYNMSGCERCGIITKTDITKPCAYTTNDSHLVYKMGAQYGSPAIKMFWDNETGSKPE